MSLPGIETHCLNSVAFACNGEYLLASGGAMVKDGHEHKMFRELIAWKLPNFAIDWHHLNAGSRISGMAVSPDGDEFIFETGTHADLWKFKTSQPVRGIDVEFLCGDVTYSTDGLHVIAPANSGISESGVLIAKWTHMATSNSPLMNSRSDAIIVRFQISRRFPSPTCSVAELRHQVSFQLRSSATSSCGRSCAEFLKSLCLGRAGFIPRPITEPALKRTGSLPFRKLRLKR